MSELSNLRKQPADEAARHIIFALLDEAAAAAVRLKAGDDAEALHDFRVAVRRMRSIGKAHRRHLGDALTRKQLKKLRAIQHATGTARDSEVQAQWIRTWADQFSEEDRAGVDGLLERLDGKVGKERPTAVLSRFAKVEKAVRRTASKIERDLFDPPDQYGNVVAGLIRSHVAGLLADLETIRNTKGDTQMTAIHDARIAGKRLRYLVEPVRTCASDAKAVVRQLKRLQDLLGDLHDMHVLIEHTCRVLADVDPAERVGVAAVVRIAGTHENALLRSFRADWEVGAQTLLETSEALARDLEGAADLEIERKFLLRGLPEEVHGRPAAELTQGYLPGGELRERLRRVRKGGAVKYLRTLKAGRGLTRIEVEEETTAEVFNQMWPLTEGARVHKRRYAIEHDGLVWEIDEFLDRELVLAEVELPNENVSPTPPEWLAPYIERDVTEESTYVNQNLAR